MKTTWDFVEKYYPNYTGSDEITENDDLHKIINSEIEGNAEIIYNEVKDELKDLFGYEPEPYQILDLVGNRFYVSQSNIFKKAIEGYIESENEEVCNLVDIAFRSDNSASGSINKMKITINKADKFNILKAQQMLKDNSFISNIRVNITSDIIYLDDNNHPTEDWRVDVEQFIIYSNSFYLYAQCKWDSSDYIESIEITL